MLRWILIMYFFIVLRYMLYSKYEYKGKLFIENMVLKELYCLIRLRCMLFLKIKIKNF